MAGDLTIDEKVARGAEQGVPMQAPVKVVEAGAEAQARTLSPAEKVIFAAAGVFCGVILMLGVLLTIAGFIFSPASETLVFALLTGAFGMVLYVIWRGGRK